MSFNRHSGGGYRGYYGGGGRFGGSGGGFRNGSAGYGNVWQPNAGLGYPMPRYPQPGSLPTHLSNVTTDHLLNLLQSTNAMPVSSFTGGPNRSSNWIGNGPRMTSMGMRKQYGPGVYRIDNRQRGGDKFGSLHISGPKDSNKRKSGATDENKKGQSEREKTKEQMEADKKASYVGVPPAVLFCHVCSKHMWDTESFEKHIRGRPHELMTTYLDESYRMKVDLMRHQIKAVESQRKIDLERVSNKQKSNSNKNSANPNVSKPLLRSYCPMCDVSFYGPLTGHRKSDRHKKLKEFLHPECKLCNALFHTRLEMDEHKLTAGHLMKVAELRKINYPHLKDDEFDLIDLIKIEDEENNDQNEMPIAKKYEMLGDCDANKLKMELEGASNEKKEKKYSLANKTVEKVDENDVKNNESESLNIDAINDIQAIAYDPNVAIGKELLVPLEGFVCRLCNCFLPDQQRVSIHCQTAAHYINYTTMTKMKEATSGGKKRGIDEVNECIVAAKENKVIFKVERQETMTDSEEPTVKRIKMDKVDKVIVEMETDEVKSTENVENIAKSSTDEKPDETTWPATPISKQAVTPTKVRGGPKGRRGSVVRRPARR